jgi:hypothetical protein
MQSGMQAATTARPSTARPSTARHTHSCCVLCADPGITSWWPCCSAAAVQGRRLGARRPLGRVVGMLPLLLLLSAPLLRHLPPRGAAATKKIDHFVVLLMENRPFDQLFGCMSGEGEFHSGVLDGINGTRSLPKDPLHPGAGSVNVTCGTGNYVCHGTSYAPWAPKFKNASQGHRYPYGEQDDKYSYVNGAKGGDPIQMFAGVQLPIKRAIARNFGVFNKYFASVPSYSTPNHLFIQAATSCGISSNGGFSQSACGPGSGRNASGALFPMKTIFDSMAAVHGDESLAFYINDTHPRGGGACGRHD